jgi:hypothetical protein
MKRLTVATFIVGLILVSGVVIASTLYLSNRFLSDDNKSKQSVIAQCTSKGKAHIVTVQNEAASPKHTAGKLCDTLTITNNDDRVRLMAFGVHDKHQVYDGITEQELHKGQSLTVTLNQTGTFEFHDHIGDIVQGDFTVTK